MLCLASPTAKSLPSGGACSGRAAADEHRERFELEAVGVLALVDEQLLDARPDGLAQFRVARQQLVGVVDQVREIQHAAVALVGRVKLAGLDGKVRQGRESSGRPLVGGADVFGKLRVLSDGRGQSLDASPHVLDRFLVAPCLGGA